ncbi:MAG TPA: cellulase family glycosylhydrolase [Streptosporangiaceae bacterium]|nr:cellulase family glycosylhydrolase [Streptosporangiaceae bacterium]
MKRITALLAAIVLLPFLPAAAAKAGAVTPVTIHGLTLSGLQDYLPRAAAFSPDTALAVSSMQQLKDQIHAAKASWHANGVRLQVEQDKLVGQNGRAYSRAYMADVESAVDYGLSLGLYVVINCQTEPAAGFTANEPLPTYATKAFWARIGQVYGNRDHVYFDIFNEPRDRGWPRWQRSMQSVINSIRHHGYDNVIWVDGIELGNSLDLASKYLLHGGTIVYTIHHPYGPHDAAAWDKDFGYLRAKGIPVAVGEWTNFANGYHWADAPTSVPLFLSYLQRRNIGFTAWTLMPGCLNSTNDYSSVTNLGPHWPEPGQGAGQLIRDWFEK